MKNIYTPDLKKKRVAVLVDPDKQDATSLDSLVSLFLVHSPDLILVGGSLLYNPVGDTVDYVKTHCRLPVYLFPGDASQLSDSADGIFFLTLISGRNPEFLIGQHVIAAPRLKRSGLHVIPTGYILIENGHSTSVEYMSNTRPIPFGKTDLAVATALAGEMLGLQQIYLEAGSGAAKAVGIDMIASIRAAIDLPIIVGGGIKSAEDAEKAFNAGADTIVIGTQLEEFPGHIAEFTAVRDQMNK